MDLERELKDAEARLEMLKGEVYRTTGVIDFIKHLKTQEAKNDA